MANQEFKNWKVPVKTGKLRPTQVPTKSYNLIPDKSENEARLSDLQTQVEQLRKSYAELLNMHRDQVRINELLMADISVLAGYALSNLCVNKHAENFLARLPRLLTGEDKFSLSVDAIKNIMLFGNQSVLEGLLSSDLAPTAARVIADMVAEDTMTYNASRVIKFAIRALPRALFVDKAGKPILDVVESRLTKSPFDFNLKSIHTALLTI